MTQAIAYDVEVVHETINAHPDVVYAFARRMEKLPAWASGLAAGIVQDGAEWFADSPMGRVKVTMAAGNAFRVLDHDVTLPNGVTVHNAFRVTAAGEGSALTFVVVRMPGVTAEEFHSDVAHVARDLNALKNLIEQGAVDV